MYWRSSSHNGHRERSYPRRNCTPQVTHTGWAVMGTSCDGAHRSFHPSPAPCVYCAGRLSTNARTLSTVRTTAAPVPHSALILSADGRPVPHRIASHRTAPTRRLHLDTFAEVVRSRADDDATGLRFGDGSWTWR